CEREQWGVCRRSRCFVVAPGIASGGRVTAGGASQRNREGAHRVCHREAAEQEARTEGAKQRCRACSRESGRSGAGDGAESRSSSGGKRRDSISGGCGGASSGRYAFPKVFQAGWVGAGSAGGVRGSKAVARGRD